MRQGLIGAVLAALLAGAVWAQDALPRNAGIEDTIQSQIDAFLRDDFDTAFTYASPGIQSMFGTPENFGAMVRNGYPMVWRPEELRYLELRGEGPARKQIVEIVDGAGQVHRLEYSMIRTEAGWRIDGVRVLPAPPPLA